MTATGALPGRMSAAEYLAWEQAQPDKHQFLDGEVFAMAGGSPRHSALSANVLGELRSALRGTGCQPHSSDLKVFVPVTGNFVYPDGTVTCGPVALRVGTTDVIENPRIVVEVLSKSTEQHDRGDKWADYRSIASLTDYVLVSQRRARLEHFARDANGTWLYRVAGVGEQLTLTNGTVLVVDEVYEGAFDQPSDD